MLALIHGKELQSLAEQASRSWVIVRICIITKPDSNLNNFVNHCLQLLQQYALALQHPLT